MDARVQQFFDSDRAHVFNFPLVSPRDFFRGILRNTGFQLGVAMAARHHTMADLRPLNPAPTPSVETRAAHHIRSAVSGNGIFADKTATMLEAENKKAAMVARRARIAGRSAYPKIR
jgi:hypothetical protein